jgi:hypothetical protein
MTPAEHDYHLRAIAAARRSGWWDAVLTVGLPLLIFGLFLGVLLEKRFG